MKYVKYDMETDNNNTYKFCMKYCVQATNYKHGEGEKLRGYVQ